MPAIVSLVKTKGYERGPLKKAISESVSLLGGLDKFLRPGQKVLLKPNLLMAAWIESAITTHPEFIRSVAELLINFGAKVYIGDSPSNYGYSERVEEVYEKTGVKRIAEELDVELVRFNRSSVKDGLALTDWLDKVDCVISLPKFKTHNLTVITGSIKNLFGCVCGYSKIELHKRANTDDDFADILVKICSLVKPVLNIVDAVTVLQGNGPASSGEPRFMGLVCASADPVATDSVFCRLIGVENPAHVQKAAKAGLGVADLAGIRILGESLNDCLLNDFKLPQRCLLNFIPYPVQRLVKPLLNVRIGFKNENCIRCGLCIQACPQKALYLHNEVVVCDFKKCTLCLCCHETCPQKAITLDKSWLARRIGL